MKGISPKQQVLVVVVMGIIALIFIAPFYISVTYSFKTAQEISVSPLSLPSSWELTNFIRAIEVSNFYRALVNSIIVTFLTILIVIITSAPAAYVVTRNQSKIIQVLYYLFIGSIMLPFQVVMLPLYVNIRTLGLLNTLPGLSLAISGLQFGFAVFLVSGFVRTIPVELEEAATIDGANQISIFWKIIFPLLKPVLTTVAILTGITSWNDFQTSLILVQRPEVRTLPLTQFLFVGQFSIDMPLAFAAFTLSMIPIVTFYFIAQKSIAAGLLAGAVKG